MFFWNKTSPPSLNRIWTLAATSKRSASVGLIAFKSFLGLPLKSFNSTNLGINLLCFKINKVFIIFENFSVCIPSNISLYDLV